MKIFPRYLLRPRYLGEAKIYDLLASLRDDQAFAVHSVNLPEHEYKRWGEADFVIVSPAGVTLLEIKGGLVSLAGREWRYENARGQAIRSTEGPARQALSAAIALEKLLTDHVGRRIRCRWGVSFPLCRFNKVVPELPASRLADIRICQQLALFESWLDSLPFDQHGPEEFALDDDEIAAIRQVIVPELSAATSLGLAVRAARHEAIRLTEQQFSILESLESNPRLCITGGAGTGKTELATLCGRADAAAGRQPAIVTASEPLSLALKERMSTYGIPVVRGTLPMGTDTLIVDEGQDFAHPTKLQKLFDQLPGGLTGGRWRWFMDPNLQFMDEPPDAGSMALISANSAAVALRRNVRSTKEIVAAIQTFLDADVGVSQIDGYGIRVGLHSVADTADEVLAAGRLLYEIMEEGIPTADVALLGAGGLDGPVCLELARRHQDLLRPLSPGGSIGSTQHGVIAAISRYRGLEARVVLLVDLHLLPADQRGEALLYMGMTRASASLHMMISPVTNAFLKVLIRRSFTRH